jgi:hypothetical protein
MARQWQHFHSLMTYISHTKSSNGSETCHNSFCKKKKNSFHSFQIWFLSFPLSQGEHICFVCSPLCTQWHYRRTFSLENFSPIFQFSGTSPNNLDATKWKFIMRLLYLIHFFFAHSLSLSHSLSPSSLLDACYECVMFVYIMEKLWENIWFYHYHVLTIKSCKR